MIKKIGMKMIGVRENDMEEMKYLVGEVKKDYYNLLHENERLKCENDELRCRVNDLEPDYHNWYNLINREREDHTRVMTRLCINNLILILALVVDFILLLIR